MVFVYHIELVVLYFLVQRKKGYIVWKLQWSWLYWWIYEHVWWLELYQNVAGFLNLLNDDTEILTYKEKKTMVFFWWHLFSFSIATIQLVTRILRMVDFAKCYSHLAGHCYGRKAMVRSFAMSSRPAMAGAFYHYPTHKFHFYSSQACIRKSHNRPIACCRLSMQFVGHLIYTRKVLLSLCSKEIYKAYICHNG